MKFKAPENVTAVFVGGFELRADKNGVAELPEGAGGYVVQAALAAGWTQLEEEAASKGGKPIKPAPAADTDDDD